MPNTRRTNITKSSPYVPNLRLPNHNQQFLPRVFISGRPTRGTVLSILALFHVIYVSCSAHAVPLHSGLLYSEILETKQRIRLPNLPVDQLRPRRAAGKKVTHTT